MVHKTFILRSLLIALLLVSAAPSLAWANSFYVPINRSELMTSNVDMGEVIIADPEVADIYVHGKRQISIIGKSLGITTVRLFDEDGKLIRSADVQVTYDLPAIRKALKEFLPYERVGVEMVNTKIALTGQVSSAAAAATAVDIASQFVKPRVDPVRETNRNINTPLPNEDNEVMNLMSIISGQQVMLRIRVGEIKRTALKDLGVSMQALKGSGSTAISIGTSAGLDNNPFGAFSLSDSAFGVGTLSYLNSAGNGLAASIDALEQDGLFKVLAEPNLVALSGEKAEFLAGGEFPIPVSQSGNSDSITLEYKPFGVAVDFTPYVLSENRIRLQVQPEVSEIDSTVSFQLNNITVPGLTTRRANTTIELAPGESFMIAGLIRDTMSTDIEQIPGIGEIPILSSLFRSTSFQREETELVIAVTPYLVDPVRSTDIKMPTDDYRPASFMESVFYGAISSIQGGVRRLSQTPSTEGPIGFMVD